MFVLSITNLPNNYNLPFFRTEDNVRWIYAVSYNEPLLLNFRLKLLSFTPQEYLEFLNIEILPLASLSIDDIESNNFNMDGQERNRRGDYQLDRFYLEGIVNRNHILSFTIDDFTREIWNFWDLEEMNEEVLQHQRLRRSE